MPLAWTDIEIAERCKPSGFAGVRQSYAEGARLLGADPTSFDQFFDLDRFAGRFLAIDDDGGFVLISREGDRGTRHVAARFESATAMGRFLVRNLAISLGTRDAMRADHDAPMSREAYLEMLCDRQAHYLALISGYRDTSD